MHRLRIAFVPGVTPDKWAKVWRERHPGIRLELLPVEEEQQRVVLDDGTADMVLARLPVDREQPTTSAAGSVAGGDSARTAPFADSALPRPGDGGDTLGQSRLHCVVLYEELPVVVVGTDHFVAAADEVTTEDLADEQLVLPERSGWRPTADQLDFPLMSVKEAVEVAAAGTGVVVLPMAVARLYHRKDVAHRPVADLPPTRIGLVWRVEDDGPVHQDFVGVTRGRRASSGRGA